MSTTDHTATVVGVTRDGQRRVRLPAADAEAARLGADAPVLLRGSGETAARVAIDDGLADRSAVVGERVADGAGVSVGDTITVEAAEPQPATRVEFAPVPDLSIRGGETAARRAAAETPLVAGDRISVSLFKGALDVPVRATAVEPDGPVLVTDATEIDLVAGPAAAVEADHRIPHVPDADVGGYADVRETLTRTVVRPLTSGDSYEAVGSVPRGGVLLTGPEGVGKTHLLRHAAWRADATFVAPDPGVLQTAGSEELAATFEEIETTATRSPRAVVHLDGLDRLGGGGRTEDGRIEQITAAVDDLRTADGVVVVGEARAADGVPDPLRRGDRLARAVEVGPPDRTARGEVLAAVTRGLQTADGVDTAAIGARAFGYTAADLHALTEYALELAVERAVSGGGAAGHAGDGRRADRPVVTQSDFETALRETEPSSLRGATVERPDVSFDDVGGLLAAKRELTRSVEWPLRHPDAFDRLGIDAPSGVLLYGPPGTGKTLLARAVAATTDANFLPVNGPELLDKYVGESERAVRELFERARANAPAVVFFDEIDALAPARTQETEASAPERVVSQLLTELDGLVSRGGITVVAATNRPDRLDPALLRPGRIDRLVEVPVPDEAARREIFRVHTRERPVGDVDYDRLAAATEGYTGSDIEAVVREASLLALGDVLDTSSPQPVVGDGVTATETTESTDGTRSTEAAGSTETAAGAEATTATALGLDGVDPAAFDDLTVGPRHFDRALNRVQPSLTEETLAEYESVVDDVVGRSPE